MRTSVHLPETDLEAFDAVREAEGFDSRSRAVREAIREYAESHTRLESIEGSIAAVLVFDYEHRAVIEDLHTA